MEESLEKSLSACYKCWVALEGDGLDFWGRRQQIDAYYMSIRLITKTIAGNNEKIWELRRLLGDYYTETFRARVNADVIDELAHTIRLLC